MAVYLTSVVPVLKVEPEAKLGDRLRLVPEEQLSVAEGADQVAVWSQEVRPAPVETVRLEGQPEMTGDVLSTTVTLKVQVDVLLYWSVAVYLTSVVPVLKVDPEA